MPLPETHTYADIGAEAPEPDYPEPCSCGRLTCDWCGDEAFASPAHDYSTED